MTTVVNTPDGIAAFRLLSLRGMLKLEKVGLKTRGGALRPRICAEFGLNKRDPHDVFIAAINAQLAVLHERIHGGSADE